MFGYNSDKVNHFINKIQDLKTKIEGHKDEPKKVTPWGSPIKEDLTFIQLMAQ